MELKDLVGKHWLFGVEFGHIDDATVMDVILDKKIISIVEDPSDGYRSSMREILINREEAVVKNIFKPVEVFGFFREGDCSIVDFVDVLSYRIVLSVGTENNDGYYPCFVALWLPKNLYLNKYSIYDL